MQQGLNILREEFLGGSDTSIEVSRVPASNTTALSPVNEGKQLVQAAMEGLRDLVLLAIRTWTNAHWTYCLARLIQSSAVTAIAVGLLAAGGPPSSGHALRAAEANWFKQGWGSTLRTTGELKRRLAGLATATSRHRECLWKAHQQANQRRDVYNSWLRRNREDGESQAEGREMVQQGKSGVLP